MLLNFKREFRYADVQRLWEVLWTNLPCPNFHMFVCLAILGREKPTIMSNRYGVTEILKVRPRREERDETQKNVRGERKQFLSSFNRILDFRV